MSPRAAVVALVLALALPVEAGAATRRHDVPDAEYIDAAAAFPEIGFAFGACSATLVSPTRALTAAHCVDRDFDGVLDFAVAGAPFLLGPGELDPTHRREVLRAVVVPEWVGGQRTFDVAVLILDAPIDDVAPAEITGQDPVGEPATLVGFGYPGTGRDADFANTAPDGIKRAVDNVLDFRDDFRDTQAFVFDFDSPDGDANLLATVYGGESDAEPLPLEGSLAPGDSGGPLFVDFGDGPRVVGVASGGGHPESTGPDNNLAGRYGSISEVAVLMDEAVVDFLRDQGVAVDGIGGEDDAAGSCACDDAAPAPALLLLLVPAAGLRRR